MDRDELEENYKMAVSDRNTCREMYKETLQERDGWIAEYRSAMAEVERLKIANDRLENDLSDGVKILETIWIAFDRDYLMRSLLSADYENLKNYLGK